MKDPKATPPALPADDKALDAFIDAGAALAGLTIAEPYRAGVKVHLAATTNAAKLVLSFPAEDDDEPGPVFRA